MKKIFKYLALISTASLMTASFALADQQQASLQSSFDKIKESVQEVKEGTKDLITAKEQENLSPEEKEKEELNLRLQVFDKIINLSIQETEDTISQLKTLNNLNEKTLSLQERLIKEFEGFLGFYDEQKKGLEKPEEISLLKIKETAQSFKDWREAIYLPELKMTANFLLINRQKITIEMTENRFKKIALDVKKLKKINFKGVEELGKYLDLAANSLKEAKGFRQKAEDDFWLIMATSTGATTASIAASSTFIGNLTINIATSTEEITAPIENASSTGVSAPPISTENQFLSIKSLIGESLNKIKEAYQIFIEMSNFVKKLLI
ncbi:hypothetical protein A3G50_01150 [Candidatus Jorgensenbacteria bacterium RIFCSPLOWO2_12_FULL_42_11]|uniref:DUF5667 domain-containing protein n=1 Tax=Candidatus Jorgensenbacteria bacterium RIFCSPLOWO2_12_FULL_42_11 TaxID=1798473 RepID=A0A1F6C2I5_9BACT|nr:MAG: hypothetical protein A3G50_01150 [Candidatus Jorgensenbacteria bacterium RIFCSPLOWO2_12_FULL_42_11]